MGNLGSALAMLWDIYSLGTISKDPASIMKAILDAIGAGENIAALLLHPNTFKATDKWPTAIGEETAPSIPTDKYEIVPAYVVYYDERYPTSWISREEAKTFRNYLSKRGFVALNSDDLKTFMENAGKYSVVIMAQDVVPDTVASTKSSSALIRQYLDRGGRVVWLEDVPFYYQGHSDGTVTTWGTSGEHDIISVYEGTWNLNKQVQIKPEGVNRGLTQTWVSIRESDDASVSQILADDDNYDAAGYVKCFNNGGEFIRIWDNSGDFTSDEYLRDLVTVATSGSLSWQVEMEAYNADSQYPRSVDVWINGYQKRIIGWLDPRQTVTANTTVPGYWFNPELNAINAWITTYDQYDYGNSWVSVKLTSPQGFRIQYFKMKPANLDRKAYFEIQMTGLWHITNYRYYSAPTALAYNLPGTHNYDTGSRTRGAFMFTADLRLYGTATKATLEFYHCLWKEYSGYPGYDIATFPFACMLNFSKMIKNPENMLLMQATRQTMFPQSSF